MTTRSINSRSFIHLFISGTTDPNFIKYSVHYEADGCGSFLLWQHCDMLCASGYVNDVTFSHNGRHRHVDTAAATPLQFVNLLTPLLRGNWSCLVLHDGGWQG